MRVRLCLGFRKDSVGFPFTWRLLNEERLTVDNPLHPPNAKSDYEADGVPGAAGPVGHRGGHHGGQGQHDDGAIKHLRGASHTEEPFQTENVASCPTGVQTFSM